MESFIRFDEPEPSQSNVGVNDEKTGAVQSESVIGIAGEQESSQSNAGVPEENMSVFQCENATSLSVEDFPQQEMESTFPDEPEPSQSNVGVNDEKTGAVQSKGVFGIADDASNSSLDSQTDVFPPQDIVSKSDITQSEASDPTKRRVCVLKLYAWIKRQLKRTEAKLIAKQMLEHNKAAFTDNDYRWITSQRDRRDTVEQLLKMVLIGPEELYDTFRRFIDQAQDQETRHIAKKLDKKNVTDQDIEAFLLLEKGTRSVSGGHRLLFSKTERQTLIHGLSERYAVDKINDQLLSQFAFTISEHSNIVACSKDRKGQAKKLIETLQQCDAKIFTDFLKILNSTALSEVAKKLERGRKKRLESDKRSVKRKSTTSLDKYHLESDLSAYANKRSNLAPSDVTTIGKRLMKNREDINQKTESHFKFQVTSMTISSIRIEMRPTDSDSWRMLKKKCCSGEIKDYFEEILQEQLPKFGVGEYAFHVDIYVLRESSLPKDQDKAIIVLELQYQISKECTDILCEELEITEDLLSQLKDAQIIDEDIDKELDTIKKRQDKIKYLLSKLEPNTKRG